MATTQQVPKGLASAIAVACQTRFGETPAIVGDPTSQTPTLTFGRDLTAPELVTLAAIISSQSGAVTITPEEFAAIKPDIDGLVAFQGLATPTLAQTVAAVKAQSRILRAILRS